MRSLIYVMGLLSILLFLSGCITTENQEFHAHADFALFIDGQRMDFNRAAFMSDANTQLDGLTHLHDFNPFVIHYHAQNIPLKRFFNSLDMKWQDDCFTIGNQTPLCNDTATGKSWKLYVNGQLNPQNENYIAKDLDRILIAYGNNTPQELHDLLNAVTDVACIQSSKCPERGTPTNETCTTAGGCSLDLNHLAAKTCIGVGSIKYCF
ncbi:MAG: hypothetical protein IPJ89_04185 [Candidatus Iainarchaeum archaeon]|uniref:Lipoprotein n=1 Tax=Candidatus Iainarchaeum sp. TaxID=3101447 RepID=A0A7T9DJ70_9ARCH|nr:MAG: hypothetical protein IPJ89_04185 [Candidatus Diapherotrites archaeon]